MTGLAKRRKLFTGRVLKDMPILRGFHARQRAR